MKKLVLQTCAMLVFGFATTQTIASAEEGSPLEGAWFAVVTPVVCGTLVPNGVPTFRGLYMFGHDGSLTNEAAFLMPPPNGIILPRSSGVGAWQHAQGQMYTAAFRFFRYNNPPDNSFLTMRRVSTVIALNGDQFTSVDMFQDFDKDNMPISGVGSSGCNTVSAYRVQ